MPNTTAKESRVKVTLYGATYTVHPSLQWISDLAEFVKAPPGVSQTKSIHVCVSADRPRQVFESVVPSERTVISVKLVDTSVRALCPTFPGATVLHFGEADFSTVLVGNSPETSLRFSVQNLFLFLLDDLNSATKESGGRVSTMSRLSRAAGSVWKV